MKKCILVGAGFDSGLNYTQNSNDIVIAVDGGVDRLIKENKKFNIAIGDFDSLKTPINFENVIKLNPIKDLTDMLYAVKYAMDLGYKEFEIYGGDGGRSSHTIANLQTLFFMARENCRAVLCGVNANYYAVYNSKIEFDDVESGYISVFAIGLACGVTIKNLKYDITDYELSDNFPIGVSNEFIGKRAEISVKEGLLLVVKDL